jgi:hypothetical protein
MTLHLMNTEPKFLDGILLEGKICVENRDEDNINSFKL